jgi:hypothetical protein
VSAAANLANLKDELSLATTKLREEYLVARESAEDLAKTQFARIARLIFEAYPAVESFSWRQYAPYFNDGDECVFRVHTDLEEIEVNGVEYDDTYSYAPGGGWQHVVEPEFADIHPVYGVVADLLESISGDTFKDMFGNHVRVTVDRQGVDVEDYHHE